MKKMMWKNCFSLHLSHGFLDKYDTITHTFRWWLLWSSALKAFWFLVAEGAPGWLRSPLCECFAIVVTENPVVGYCIEPKKYYLGGKLQERFSPLKGIYLISLFLRCTDWISTAQGTFLLFLLRRMRDSDLINDVCGTWLMTTNH